MYALLQVDSLVVSLHRLVNVDFPFHFFRFVFPWTPLFRRPISSGGLNRGYRYQAHQAQADWVGLTTLAPGTGKSDMPLMTGSFPVHRFLSRPRIKSDRILPYFSHSAGLYIRHNLWYSLLQDLLLHFSWPKFHWNDRYCPRLRSWHKRRSHRPR